MYDGTLESFEKTIKGIHITLMDAQDALDDINEYIEEDCFYGDESDDKRDLIHKIHDLAYENLQKSIEIKWAGIEIQKLYYEFKGWKYDEKYLLGMGGVDA